MPDITIQEVRQKYPDYNDLSDSQLADKLHSAFYSDMPKNEFYNKVGLKNETQEEKPQRSYNEMIGDFLKPNLKNPLPPFSNIASGLASIVGRNKNEKELIGNIPQELQEREPTFGEKVEKGLGEYIPMQLSGVNALKGIQGGLARVGTSGGYGAALNPENREKGFLTGTALGAAGELFPAAISASEKYAEKIRPIQWAKDKLKEMQDIYKSSTKEQKSYYDEALKGKENINLTENPEEYLGFDKNNLSYKAENLYDKFLKKPVLSNLQKLQSQLYRDSNRYKLSKEAEGMRIRDKSEIERENIVNKIKQILSVDKEALASYQKGVDITRDVIKPFESTKSMRDIVKGKFEKILPKKLNSILETALKSSTEIPKEHYIRKLQPELEGKLEFGKLMKSGVPEMIRKFLPKYAESMQNPTMQSIIKGSKVGNEMARKLALAISQQ